MQYTYIPNGKIMVSKSNETLKTKSEGEGNEFMFLSSATLIRS